MSISELIEYLPKCELHLHIEGTLEPDLMWQLAQKHQINLPFKNVDEIQQAYQFDDLQSFLDLYYQGADVLRDEDDFYQLMWAYLRRCQQQKIVHTEIMFDPQTHTERGIGFDVFMSGFVRAINQAKEKWGLSVCLIMSFLRHLSEESAFETLAAAEPFYEHITAVGLDSSEVGHPPEKFARVFKQAKELGFKLVAHAGEEGPPSYIWQAISRLQVNRIDHGVRAIEDNRLMAYLREFQVPLTVCPCSNTKLKVFDSMANHNILYLLEEGLCVTVNSDDPSYFGGYLTENYQQLAQHLAMSNQQLSKLVENSFRASFLSEQQKQHWIEKVQQAA